MRAAVGGRGPVGWLRRAVDGVRRLRVAGRGDPDRAAAPHVVLTTGPAVPAVALRAALALVSAGAVALAFAGAPPAASLVLVAVAVVPAVRPRSVATALVVLAVGVRVLVGGPPEPWRLALLVLLLHALVWLTALAARTGRRTRVEVAVLRDAAPAALAAQAGAQALALVATALAGGAPGGDVWRVAGVVTATLVALVVLVRPAEPWWRRDEPGG